MPPRRLIAAGERFDLESTLSGKTYVALLRAARERGFRIVLHSIVIGSARQAVERVRLPVSHAGHHVPEKDVTRRFERSITHFLNDSLPADEGGLWDNVLPPITQVAGNKTHTVEEMTAMLNSTRLEDSTPVPPSDSSGLVLEASRAATAKMLEFYRRMGIKVTPEMTLAPDQDENFFTPPRF